jgi:hypothetical protein
MSFVTELRKKWTSPARTQKNRNMRAKILYLLSVLALIVCSNSASSQGTAFTYQGHLQNNGNPATGTYNFTFTLFATNVNGTAVAGPVTNNGVSVNNGLFTTTINFGSNVFTGTANWLQIGVATNGTGTFTVLVPRQQLTPVPYAVYASNGAPTGAGFVYSGVGSPVGTLSPAAPTAMYFDTTIPSEPNLWYWENSTWREFLGH